MGEEKIEQIRSILEKNKDSIAFLIGNGIHSQYHDCTLSWNKLIQKLCEAYYPVNFPILGRFQTRLLT